MTHMHKYGITYCRLVWHVLKPPRPEQNRRKESVKAHVGTFSSVFFCLLAFICDIVCAMNLHSDAIS